MLDLALKEISHFGDVLSIFKSYSDNIIAVFYSRGVVSTRGTCSVNVNCVPPGNSVIFRNNNNEVIGFIDQKGNMCIERGNCHAITNTCHATANDIAFRAANGRTPIVIKENGELCHEGPLFENMR